MLTAALCCFVGSCHMSFFSFFSNTLAGKYGRDELEELFDSPHLDLAELCDRVASTRDVEVFVSCQLYTEQEPIGLPVCTTYRCFPAETKYAVAWRVCECV